MKNIMNKEVKRGISMVTIRVFGTNNQNIIKITKSLRNIVKKCCISTLYEEGYRGDYEVSVTFTDNNDIHVMNLNHRDIDRPTDVLSFPLMDENGFSVNPETDCMMLGDIVISVEKAIEQAEEFGHSFEREIAFLTVHSMLHLLGYDHVTSEEEEKEMFAKQDLILDALGITRDFKL